MSSSSAHRRVRAAARSSSMPRGRFLAPAILALAELTRLADVKDERAFVDQRLGFARRQLTRGSPRLADQILQPFATAQSLPAFRAPFHRRVLDAYARVDRDATVRAGEHGVQIELGDLGHLLAEAAQPEDELRERFRIGRRRAAEPGDEQARPSPWGRAPPRRRRSAARSGTRRRRSARPARRRGRTRRAGRTPDPGRRPRATRRPSPSVARRPATRSARAASRTSCSSRRPSATPPVSVLCTPAAAVLITTGKPTSAAAATASSTVAAMRSATSGTPNASRSTRISAGSSQPSTVVSTKARARRTSMPSSSGTTPTGRRSHSARSAARASARAADSG